METIVTPPPENGFPNTDEIADTDRLPIVGDIIDVPPPGVDPPPELVEAVVHYFTRQRADLLNRVANMETLLGFITPEDKDLAVRVALLERFCGVKG